MAIRLRFWDRSGMEHAQRDPQDYGYWDGDAFVFTPPITVMTDGGLRKLSQIDLSRARLADLVTPEEVVRALADSNGGDLGAALPGRVDRR